MPSLPPRISLPPTAHRAFCFWDTSIGSILLLGVAKSSISMQYNTAAALYPCVQPSSEVEHVFSDWHTYSCIHIYMACHIDPHWLKTKHSHKYKEHKQLSSCPLSGYSGWKTLNGKYTLYVQTEAIWVPSVAGFRQLTYPVLASGSHSFLAVSGTNTHM